MDKIKKMVQGLSMDVIALPSRPRLLPPEAGDRYRWETAEDINIKVGSHTYTIEKGFKTDIASIPGIFQPIAKEYGGDAIAFVFHDWAYLHKYTLPYTRLQIDQGMRTLMKKTLLTKKVKGLLRLRYKARIFVVYRAVRLFGWIFYRKWINLG